MAKADLNSHRLRELLHYDPETGIFTWLPRPIESFSDPASAKRWLDRYAGKPAGHHREDGYFDIRLDGHLHRAHRLAWLYMTGEWPTNLLDHKDRNPANTKWDNLRPATHSQNHQNQVIRKDSTAPYRGIELHQHGGWKARITVRGKRIHLGYFKTPEEARDARIAGEKKYFTHAPVCEPPA